jgi:predicted ATPase
MMGPVVRSLILKRFRSVPTGHVEFDNPTFLVGRNGAGKSNIADAIAFLAEAMTSPLQEVFDRRGGINSVRNRTSGRSFPPNFGLAVECNPTELNRKPAGSENIKAARYGFEIKALPEYKFEIVREQCVVTTVNGSKHWFDRRKNKFESNVEPFTRSGSDWLVPGALAMPLIGGIQPFAIASWILRSMKVYSIEPSKLREMQDPDSGNSLRRDGTNAASVLEEIKRDAPKDLVRIEEFLSNIVPNTNSVYAIKHGKKLALGFTQEWGAKKRLSFEAFNMSDGTLRAFGLLLAVFQRAAPSVIVVEEPEASIHPAAAGAVLDLLRHATRQMQVIVSTHSPEILDAKWIEDKHLRVVSWQEGESRVSRVSELSRKALQDHLMGAGELLRSEALEPSPLFDDVNQTQMSLFEEVSR